MTYSIKVRRQAGPGMDPYWATYSIDAPANETVSTVLERINDTLEDPIAWDCSCLQKKCGACAMRINGIPKLACGTFVGDYPDGQILLEPLLKFPIIKDLVTNRTKVYDILKDVRVWVEGTAYQDPKTLDARFSSAGCLVCGCCLEACPNFSTKEVFTGALGAVNGFRAMDDSLGTTHAKDVAKQLHEAFYSNCIGCLSCMRSCSIGLPVDELLVRVNRKIAWKKR